MRRIEARKSCTARYRANGQLDRTFSDNGKARTRFGSNNQVSGTDLALQPDGRIVVAGSVTLGGNAHDFGVARYLANTRPAQAVGRNK
jgi:hypothetical protein